MKYVISEIFPWVLAALIIGFLLGLFYWWCRSWLAKAHMSNDEIERLTTMADAHQTRANEAATRLDAASTELATLRAGTTSEATALRARIADLEASGSDISLLETRIAGLESAVEDSTALRARITELEVANVTIPGLLAKISNLESGADRTVDSMGATALDGATGGRKVASPPLSHAGIDIDPVIDLTTGSQVLGIKLTKDDLKVVEGIGPAIERLLRDAGIDTWRELSTTAPSAIAEILGQAGPRFRIHDPGTWPDQARFLSNGMWDDFKSMTDRLKGGRVV